VLHYLNTILTRAILFRVRGEEEEEEEEEEGKEEEKMEEEEQAGCP